MISFTCGSFFLSSPHPPSPVKPLYAQQRLVIFLGVDALLGLDEEMDGYWDIDPLQTDVSRFDAAIADLIAATKRQHDEAVTEATRVHPRGDSQGGTNAYFHVLRVTGGAVEGLEDLLMTMRVPFRRSIQGLLSFFMSDEAFVSYWKVYFEGAGIRTVSTDRFTWVYVEETAEGVATDFFITVTYLSRK